MRGLLGIAAVALGVLGALACPAAIGLYWWAAAQATDRAADVAARLDHGLSEADARLERVEGRLAVVRADLAQAHREAEKLAAENPGLDQVRTAIDRLVDRLLPTVERAAELADSMRTVAAGLRAVEDVAADLGANFEQPSRARAAADAIDRAAEMLDFPQERVNAVKSAAALRVRREIIELALAAAAGSEQLAEGLAGARREIGGAREQVNGYRARFVSWVRVTDLSRLGPGTRRAPCRPPLPRAARRGD
jgi:hypothetical protein